MKPNQTTMVTLSEYPNANSLSPFFDTLMLSTLKLRARIKKLKSQWIVLLGQEPLSHFEYVLDLK